MGVCHGGVGAGLGKWGGVKGDEISLLVIFDTTRFADLQLHVFLL